MNKPCQYASHLECNGDSCVVCIRDGSLGLKGSKGGSSVCVEINQCIDRVFDPARIDCNECQRYANLSMAATMYMHKAGISTAIKRSEQQINEFFTLLDDFDKAVREYVVNGYTDDLVKDDIEPDIHHVAYRRARSMLVDFVVRRIQ